MKMKFSISSLDAKTYYDKDVLLLHTVMQMVVDYVEIELASVYQLNNPTLKYKLYSCIPKCFRNDNWIRSRKLGLKYLNDVKKLEKKFNQDLIFNKTLKEVYLWWTDIRPKRPDPNEASGLLKCIKNNKNCTDRQVDAAVKKAMKLEKKFFDEDTKMLKKIIDIREYLWI